MFQLHAFTQNLKREAEKREKQGEFQIRLCTIVFVSSLLAKAECLLS